MIFGSNINEGGLFALGAYLSPVVSADNYTIFLNQNFGAAANLVAKQYPLTLPQFTTPGKAGSPASPAFEAISAIITDAQFTCPLYQAMLKAEAINMPVYTYLNKHVPHCPWQASPPPAALPLIGATHTSEIPLVFGNGVNQPLISGNGSCNFTAAETTISETLIAAWTSMAVSGNPNVGGWVQWSNSSSQGFVIGANATSVGAIDYSFCQFWDMINADYLSFTNLSSTNGTSGSGGGGSGSGTKSGSEKGAEMGLGGLTMAVGIVISVLIS